MGGRSTDNDGVVVLDNVLADEVSVSRRSDVLWRVAPQFLVVATLDDEVYEAAGKAPEIWQAMDRPITIGGLIASLAGAHALAPEQIRDGVITFLAELVAAGLVKTEGADPPNGPLNDSVVTGG